jgi:HPt (histidine-containing phosphotransfer) domain-containing protein
MYSKVGMNGFLAKPFTETQLLKCISEALGYGKVEINDMSLEGSAEIEAAIDFGQLRSLSGDNMEFYADMLQTFKKSCESGLIKLREHFEKEDWYLVSEYAHKMCSPCRHLRAYALHRTLKELEGSARDHPDTGSIEILIEKAGVQYSEISKILDEELLATEN